MCHIILIMPILSLALFWVFPMSVALPIYIVVLLFSVIIYNSLIHAMHTPVKTGRHGLIGHKAIVLDFVKPEGHVQVHGEIWRAESPGALRKGEKVDVVGIEGLTLKVRK